MRHLRQWGALYLLIAFFLLSWYGQYATEWREFVNDTHTHHQAALRSEFWPQFWSSTFENWQSEFLQLATQALLIASWLQRYTFRADYSADKEDVAQLNGKLDAALAQLSSMTRERGA